MERQKYFQDWDGPDTERGVCWRCRNEYERLHHTLPYQFGSLRIVIQRLNTAGVFEDSVIRGVCALCDECVEAISRDGIFALCGDIASASSSDDIASASSSDDIASASSSDDIASASSSDDNEQVLDLREPYIKSFEVVDYVPITYHRVSWWFEDPVACRNWCLATIRHLLWDLQDDSESLFSWLPDEMMRIVVGYCR